MKIIKHKKYKRMQYDFTLTKEEEQEVIHRFKLFQINAQELYEKSNGASRYPNIEELYETYGRILDTVKSRVAWRL